jgi:hypothetical protein
MFKQQFERTTALFGLVLSNVLIINVWTQDIGRFSASNLEIIKIIFEINLRFFNQESAKHLLFVIRDFKETENLEYIKNIITEDINRLWNEIKKPKQFEKAKPEDFFQLKFFPLHHYVYEKDQFLKDTQELARRMRDPKVDGFIFSEVDTSKNIPYDALFMFADKVWESIKENKELNLPSQKVIVSNFRCSEVKKEVLEQSMIEVDRLKNSVTQNFHPHLRTELEEVLNKSITEFRSQTEQYDDEIVRESESQLRRDSHLQFELVSAIQKDKIEASCAKWMREKVAESKHILNFGQMLATIKVAKKEAIDRYRKELNEGTTDDEASIEKLVERFKGKVESIAVEFISTKVNLLLKNLQNQKQKELEARMSRIFTDLQPTFWEDFLSLYSNTFENYSEDILKLRNDAEELKSALDEQLFDSMKLDLYLTIRSSLSSQLKSLGTLVTEKFRRLFENDPSGMRRNWVTTEESEINSLFAEAKNEVIAVLDRANNMALPGLLSGGP